MDKGHPVIWHDWHRGGDQRYSSTHALPQHQIQVTGQHHAPPAVPTGRGPGIPCREMWTPEPVWTGTRKRKYLVPTKIRTQTFQPVASRYTD